MVAPLSSENLKGFMRKLDLTEARQMRKITDTYRNIVREIFIDIVAHTPQFTGNLVYGWQIVFGPWQEGLPEMFTPSERKDYRKAYRKDEWEPYERGDDPAVGDVLDRELAKLNLLKWNSNVRIVNNVEYAAEVDAGQGPEGRPIRPENLYYGKVFMTSYAEVKYSRLRNLVKITS